MIMLQNPSILHVSIRISLTPTSIPFVNQTGRAVSIHGIGNLLHTPPISNSLTPPRSVAQIINSLFLPTFKEFAVLVMIVCDTDAPSAPTIHSEFINPFRVHHACKYNKLNIALLHET